ncbi:MAG: tetratricopeptide repeat protein [Bacteroidota bacterium]
MSEDSKFMGIGLLQDLDKLEGYVEGNLSAEEMAQAEQEIAEDPMLQDMIQGLRELDNPAAVKSNIARIRARHEPRLIEKMKKRSQMSKRKFRVQPERYLQLSIAIAAGLALTVLSVYIISNGKKATPPMADAGENIEVPASQVPERVAPDVNAVVVLDSAKEEKIEKPERADDYLAEATIPENKDELDQESVEDFVETVLTEKTADIVEADVFADVAKESPKPVVNEPPQETALPDPAPRETAVTSPAPSTTPSRPGTAIPSTTNTYPYDDAIPDGVITIGPVTESKPVNPRDTIWKNYYEKGEIAQERRQAKMFEVDAYMELINEGSAAYEAQNYERAKESFDEILYTNPDHVPAHYYMGMCHYHLGEYKASIDHLKVVLEHPGIPVFEESQWTIAQSYLELDKKPKARKILADIVKGKGIYSPQAEELLKNL